MAPWAPHRPSSSNQNKTRPSEATTTTTTVTFVVEGATAPGLVGPRSIFSSIKGDPTREAVCVAHPSFPPGPLRGPARSCATAHRVAGISGPREVLVSSTVKDLVVGSRIEFEDRDARAQKGVPGGWRIFAVKA